VTREPDDVTAGEPDLTAGDPEASSNTSEDAAPADSSRADSEDATSTHHEEASDNAGAEDDDHKGRGDQPAGARLRIQAVAALSLIVVVLAGGVFALASDVRAESQTDNARAAGLTAARSHVEKILSYDYRTLDHDFAVAKRGTTGKFRKEYSETIDEVVADNAKRYHVVVRAEVVAASVVDASPARVVTLLFVNQATQSTRVQGAKIDKNRVVLTVRNFDGRWLVSSLEAL
jgi:Mce-associated membrane protein